MRNIVDFRVELNHWSDCSYGYFICYIFQVIARELRTNPKRSSSVKMTVNILDVNDNQPQFGNSSYSAQIAENAPTGTTFTRLQVRPSSDSIYLSRVLLTFEICANVFSDIFASKSALEKSVLVNFVLNIYLETRYWCEIQLFVILCL